MTNKQANLIGTTTMLILTLMLVYAITCISCKPQDTTQKQHNFQVGDDTEHIWIGGNGDTIIE
tara:strand:+ start:31 stop:219 length:189 start_codon:yes stop_codon:yes gene_type:complete